jgi:hypothetical protein
MGAIGNLSARGTRPSRHAASSHSAGTVGTPRARAQTNLGEKRLAMTSSVTAAVRSSDVCAPSARASRASAPRRVSKPEKQMHAPASSPPRRAASCAAHTASEGAPTRASHYRFSPQRPRRLATAPPRATSPRRPPRRRARRARPPPPPAPRE